MQTPFTFFFSSSWLWPFPFLRHWDAGFGLLYNTFDHDKSLWIHLNIMCRQLMVFSSARPLSHHTNLQLTTSHLMYFSFGLLTLPFGLCDEVWYSSRFHFLYLTPSSESWHSKTNISKGTVYSKIQTFCKFNTFCPWNYNPVHKIYTDTTGLSVKCLLLTSYFPTLFGHTQQNTAVSQLFVRFQSSLNRFLIDSEFGHKFSLCVQWEQRGGVYMCGAFTLNVEKGFVHQRAFVAVQHISVTL